MFWKHPFLRRSIWVARCATFVVLLTNNSIVFSTSRCQNTQGNSSESTTGNNSPDENTAAADATLPVHYRATLIARSGEPFRIEMVAERQISSKTCFASLIRFSKIADDIDLTAQQKSKFEAIHKTIGDLNQELIKRLDSDKQETKDALASWIKDKASEVDAKIDDVLLAHQLDALAAIRASYSASFFGFAKVLSALKEAGNSDLSLSTQSLREVELAERAVANEMKSQNVAFVEKHMRSVLSILNDKQRDQLGTFFNGFDHFSLSLPELFVSQARIAEIDKIDKEFKLPNDKYSIWGTTAYWELGYDGAFCLTLESTENFNLDYLVTSLVHDQKLCDSLEIVEFQSIELKKLLVSVQEYHQRISKAFQESGAAAIGEIVASKDKAIRERLDEILLAQQKRHLDEQRLCVLIRRTGIFYQLAQGELRQLLQVNESQVNQVNKLAKEVIADWEKIDNESVKQIKSKLVEAVTDQQDRESLREFFANNHRVARLPTGIFATSLSK